MLMSTKRLRDESEHQPGVTLCVSLSAPYIRFIYTVA